jgi:activator of HSP90 ATPase
MRAKMSSLRLVSVSTRRQLLTGIAIALGGVAAETVIWGQTQTPMKEAQSTEANKFRTSLHQEIAFKASPKRLYDVLLGSDQFAAFTGMPATIDPKAGGAFSTFGGLVVGRNVETLPSQRIVQAWRPSH